MRYSDMPLNGYRLANGKCFTAQRIVELDVGQQSSCIALHQEDEEDSGNERFHDCEIRH